MNAELVLCPGMHVETTCSFELVLHQIQQAYILCFIKKERINILLVGVEWFQSVQHTVQTHP